MGFPEAAYSTWVADSQESSCWFLDPHHLAVIRKDGIILKSQAGEDSINLI